jgi:hypothetical protein
LTVAEAARRILEAEPVTFSWSVPDNSTLRFMGGCLEGLTITWGDFLAYYVHKYCDFEEMEILYQPEDGPGVPLTWSEGCLVFDDGRARLVCDVAVYREPRRKEPVAERVTMAMWM